VKRYMISVSAYDKDGKRLNGNTWAIDAENQRDAIELAKSKQWTNVATVKVVAKIGAVFDRKQH
jgi:hypothetical protein